MVYDSDDTQVDLTHLKPYDWQFEIVERHRAGEVFDPESEDGDELPFAIDAVEYWEKLQLMSLEEQRNILALWDRIQEKSDADDVIRLGIADVLALTHNVRLFYRSCEHVNCFAHAWCH